MGHNIKNMLDNIEADLERKMEKVKKLRENQDCIQYRRDNGSYGISWQPLTEESADVDYNLDLDELRVDLWYLVKTNDGIRLLNEDEYATFMGDTVLLYKGTYYNCKNFIKV